MTIDVAAPPEVPEPGSAAPWLRLVPVATAVVMAALAATLYRSGPGTPLNPVLLVFPVMMLVTAGMTMIAGRRTDLDADRRAYLDYLSGVRREVIRVGAAQRFALTGNHPDPLALWTVAGLARTGDVDDKQVRVGVGAVPLATRLVAPQLGPRVDPVLATAVRRFVDTHATLAAAPATISLGGLVTVDGEPGAVRGLLRAVICQLAVRYTPDQLLLIGVFDRGGHAEWDWLKWLPHHQHPTATDAAGPVRMQYPNLAAARRALTGRPRPQLVVLIDGEALDGREQFPTGGQNTTMTVLAVGVRCETDAATGARLTLRAGELRCRDADNAVLTRPDRLSVADALVCARRLAGHHGVGHAASWAQLAGVGDPAQIDLNTLWRSRNSHDRFRVPIGTTPAGATVDLDIKEAADGGMGPHGLCVGATGSGKSELLRTIVLGLVARHAPDDLNLVLIDFKGGATFFGLEQTRHIAAVITNLADEEPLVDRMRDALSGELTRRQELLRATGCVSVAAYRGGPARTPLPELLIIVDEFSELLSQHPDFVDMFVAIGRLGRSLGMHLLLASQRIDEGRLRGLESHLSYRICLKTLSAAESRLALGSAAAYELPNTPGAGYLQSAAGELIRFHAAYVSEPVPAAEPVATTVQLFTADACGPASTPSGAPTVLQTVVRCLTGRGTPAHQVWLPPLERTVALGPLLAAPNAAALHVPIGIVDRPLEQRRSPLVLDLAGATGNLAVVGGPQAGKSTALCTVITALAATHPAGRAQFYCLDFGGGVLDALRPLPHVGEVVSASQPELISRTVGQVEALIIHREARFRALGIGAMADYRRLRAAGDPRCADDPFGDVFLVVDGWARLRYDFEALEASITALAARGLSFGAHVMVSASRWADLRPALKDQLGTRIELRLGDPADSELNRRCARQVPLGAPGRGLTADGLQLLVAAPFDTLTELSKRRDGYRAPRVRMLPDRVEQSAVRHSAGADAAPAVLLGVEERELRAVPLDFRRQPHLVVFGEAGSGKTSALRTLCAEIIRTAPHAQLLVVDYRRSLLGATERCGYAPSAAALAELLPALLELLRQRMPGAHVSPQQLRARSWWAGPEIYLVIDDYDLVIAGAGNPLAALLEFLPYAGDLGLHVLLARRSGGAARAMFEPLLAGLRELGAMGLMLSGSPEDGPLFDAVRPVPLPPGRGTLITRGGAAQRIQVGWSPPS